MSNVNTKNEIFQHIFGGKKNGVEIKKCLTRYQKSDILLHNIIYSRAHLHGKEVSKGVHPFVGL